MTVRTVQTIMMTVSGVETATEKWGWGEVLTDHSSNFNNYYYEIVKYII